MISNFYTLGALMMLLGSCSFAMSGVDPAWDGKQEPVCAESYAPVIVDGITASAASAVAVGIVEDDEIPLDVKVQVAAGAIALSLLYTVSASTGASKYKECRIAKADWYAREALRESHEETGVAPHLPSKPSVPAAASPRLVLTTPTGQAVSTGYFCTNSPSRGSKICRRERAVCEQARRLLAAPDSEDCTPVNAIWCFDTNAKSRCFVTQHACEAQRVIVSTASGTCIQRL